MNELPLTGERTLPGIPAESYWFQRHVAAYRYAGQVARGAMLDVGCGEGYGPAMLDRAIAMDLDPEIAAYAARRYPGLRVAVADACHLPVRDEAFDTVLALQVLEHLYCADRFVASCRRVLRPGGVLVLSTPNRDTFSPDGVVNPFHVYEYTAPELEALLGVYFADVRMLGLRHGRLLRAAEHVLVGERTDRALIRAGYEGLGRAARSLVRAVRPGQFRIGRPAEAGLDLVAVCRH